MMCTLITDIMLVIISETKPTLYLGYNSDSFNTFVESTLTPRFIA